MTSYSDKIKDKTNQIISNKTIRFYVKHLIALSTMAGIAYCVPAVFIWIIGETYISGIITGAALITISGAVAKLMILWLFDNKNDIVSIKTTNKDSDFVSYVGACED